MNRLPNLLYLVSIILGLLAVIFFLNQVAPNYTGTSYCRENFNAANLPVCTSLESYEEGGFYLSDLLTLIIRGAIIIIFFKLALNIILKFKNKDINSKQQQNDIVLKSVKTLLLFTIVVLLFYSIERILYKQKICFGISCNFNLPTIIESPSKTRCCLCWKGEQSDITQKDIIDLNEFTCSELEEINR